MRTVYVVCIAFLWSVNTTHAQLIDFLSVGSDSTCIADHSDMLVLRVLGMRKFNKYTLGQYGLNNNVAYRANNNYHAGIGFHYKWVGANLTFKLPYFTGDKFGKTKYFDLQSYIYANRFALDLYILSYKGYYLADNSILKSPYDQHRLIRPDVHSANYGANFQYIFNYKRFSYRATFVQSQCQLRSAGTPIAGGGIHYSRAKADSAIIPANIKDDLYHGSSFNKSGVFSLAINGGYAYTYVFARHFFVTASLLLGTGLNYTTITDITDNSTAKLQAQLNAVMRAGVGYNTPKYFVGLQYTNYTSRNNMPIQDTWQQLQTGNVRLVLAKRFKLREKTVKRLEEIEDAVLPDID